MKGIGIKRSRTLQWLCAAGLVASSLWATACLCPHACRIEIPSRPPSQEATSGACSCCAGRDSTAEPVRPEKDGADCGCSCEGFCARKTATLAIDASWQRLLEPTWVRTERADEAPAARCPRPLPASDLSACAAGPPLRVRLETWLI